METIDRRAIDQVVLRKPGPIQILVGVETLHFLLRHLPPPPSRLLEVGCGDGVVAFLLGRHGYAVVAVDSDEGAVTRARELGVNARVASFPDAEPDFEDRTFEAVLFTRSLHHISPLDAAVDRSRRLLADGGRVLVEDFAPDEMGAASIGWFRNRVDLLRGGELLVKEGEGFGGRLLRDDDAVTRWREEHDDLHSATEIRCALERAFDRVRVETAPYLFRYVAPMVPPAMAGFDALRRFLRAEWESIATDRLAPVGRRFVADLSASGPGCGEKVR